MNQNLGSMKNPILSTLVIMLFMSTTVFGQRDQRVIKSRSGSTQKVVKRTNRTTHTTRVASHNRNIHNSGNRYAVNHRQNQVRVSRKVRRVRTLPNRYQQINYRGRGYYFHSGRFYQYRNGYYNVVAAPIGYRFRVLPAGCTRIVRGPNTYFVNAGTYYRFNQSFGYYEVIQPPSGLLLYELPYGSELVTVNGLLYYEYGGVFYRKVETQYGYAYKVAGEINS